MAEFELVTCLSDSISSSLEKYIYGYSHVRVGVPSMRTALLVGGLPIAKQLYRLKSGVQVHQCDEYVVCSVVLDTKNNK